MSEPVLVIGGGAAGAATAILLTRAGRRVTLIEQHRDARHKICGEFLSTEACASLAMLGVDLISLGAVPVDTVRLAGGGSVAEAALPFRALSLTRRTLDEALLALAAASGVELLRGARAESVVREPAAGGSGDTCARWSLRLSNGCSLETSTLFVATGKHDLRGHARPSARGAKLVAFKQYFRLTEPQRRALACAVELVVFRGGYAGLQMVEEDLANLCLLVEEQRLRAVGSSWSKLLSALCAAEPHLQMRLHGAEPMLAQPLALSHIPYGFLAQPEDTFWRVGDQAAVIPSFTGDGISIALHTARIAAPLLSCRRLGHRGHQAGTPGCTRKHAPRRPAGRAAARTADAAHRAVGGACVAGGTADDGGGDAHSRRCAGETSRPRAWICDAPPRLQWAGMTGRLNVAGGARRRYFGVLACTPLLLLIGCPQDQAAAPAKVSPQVTAPAVRSAAPPVAGATLATQSASPAPSEVMVPAQTPAETAAHLAQVQQLINQAERSYASGVNNYRAQHLDAAKNDFDAAVDLLLTSGMDLKSEPQLADEFDHLLNAVNSLEMAALKQGNGFAAPTEAAPVDAAADVTFPANPQLTAKLNSELKSTQSDLPLVINDSVAGYISYFSNSSAFHAHMRASLERAGKYRTMIQKMLVEEGVPQDLIYLSVAESGFQPQALNPRSGAGGMWQFMPTGAYGLARNGWVDERFDPEKSSRAYARYIKSLYNQFGDWYLAMAAYDWGPGKVQRAVMRTGYADFWELYRRNALPSETKDYVPKILAAVIMAKNPERYGLDKLVPLPPVLSDTVQTESAIDLHLVADVTEVSVGEIVALNPSLLRSTTPRDMSFDLHIPPGTRELFTERLKEIPEDKRASWRFHVVRGGETLDEIAIAMHARVSDLTEANGLSAGDALSAGDELVVPLATVTSSHPARYVAARGDTLVTVADRFNVSVEDLRRWNHLSSNAVHAGRTLTVAEPVHLAPTGRARSRASRSRASRSARNRRASSAYAGRSRTVGRSSVGPSRYASRSSRRVVARDTKRAHH